MPRNLHCKEVLIGVVLAVLVAGLPATMPAEAAFPGANGMIVFDSTRTAGPGVNNPQGDPEIFAVNPDGSGLRQLTSNARSDRDAAYSPDGQRIVFVRDGREIWVMNANDSVETQLTEAGKPESFERDPSFSPDGEKIVFARGIEGDLRPVIRADIYKMDASDGSNQVKLTNTRGVIELAPDWSPGGKKIAFDATGAIYKMNASDGSARTRLTGRELYASDPAWSPDGRKVTFDAVNDRVPGPNRTDIYKMKADGSERTRLTESPTFDLSPAWSPEGDQIVFYSDRDGDETDNNSFSIVKMNADGSDEEKVTDGVPKDFAPDWQPVSAP
jgi:TolB protein